MFRIVFPFYALQTVSVASRKTRIKFSQFVCSIHLQHFSLMKKIINSHICLCFNEDETLILIS